MEPAATDRAPKPAAGTQRGVEVSNKLDKDGTLIKGTPTHRPPSRNERLVRFMRLSPAHLSRAKTNAMR
jgi:hypothetical protein